MFVIVTYVPMFLSPLGRIWKTMESTLHISELRERCIQLNLVLKN